MSALPAETYPDEFPFDRENVTVAPAHHHPSRVNPGRAWTTRTIRGCTYWRAPIHTPWFEASDDLVAALLEHTPDRCQGDTVAISETVAVLLTGRAVAVTSVRPRLLARLLARAVRPPGGTRGLSMVEKMEYVVRTCGLPRTLVAALASALTRPWGIRGVFYHVAGDVARDLDGGQAPYERLLIPPLTPVEAKHLCAGLQDALGTGVAIVDLDDSGGTVRATSPLALPPVLLGRVMADNPMGEGFTGTPFSLVRRVDAATA